MTTLRDIRESKPTHPGASAAGRYVFIPFAILITWVLCRTRITPNQVTYFWGILMIVGSLGFLLGDYRADIVCGLLWVIAYTLDCADGRLARATGRKSDRGDYIDSINHRATYPLLMFCVGYECYSLGTTEILGISIDPFAYLFLGILAGTSMVIIMDVGNAYNRICPKEAFAANSGGVAEAESRKVKNKERFQRIMSFMPHSFENMILLIPVFAAFACLELFIIFYGVAYLFGAFVRYILFLRMIPAVKARTSSYNPL